MLRCCGAMLFRSAGSSDIYSMLARIRRERERERIKNFDVNTMLVYQHWITTTCKLLLYVRGGRCIRKKVTALIVLPASINTNSLSCTAQNSTKPKRGNSQNTPTIQRSRLTILTVSAK
jgi:hypothetical protein